MQQNELNVEYSRKGDENEIKFGSKRDKQHSARRETGGERATTTRRDRRKKFLFFFLSISNEHLSILYSYQHHNITTTYRLAVVFLLNEQSTHKTTCESFC